MLKIAVLVSGGGSNLGAIIDGVKSGELSNVEIKYVISDTPEVYALERAKENNIQGILLDKKQYKSNLSDEILKLIDGEVDLIVLAGFFSILSGKLLEKFKHRIINIHPSLIPSFCGKGAYGIHVHEKALEYGVKVSGCTVHFVDEGTDTGAIILQKVVEVNATDTPKELQLRIMEKEHEALPEAVKLISEGKVRVEGRKVFIG
ncbi:phosphoribosylglycinamide formyltransferase [Inconstantimicrobium mannanitabidum]|uniref:Phosphoribosylglycinamide formyltransferase n=1 Tax=Inconstantimicrobium mannanitabidum TaxID=1604901 RepID=A0ACB5RC39_9CLOT|nr:phosphoribosylglycinamide formyltransferase [Clostridium sp. TW13]GKX66700.1 phosphoribosylglycinamide formyltransferase [Clostridium sp. TW13]